LDSIEITALRTGAATAVAAKYLARPDSKVATVAGCGVQGRVQLKSLAQVLRLEKVYAYDQDEALSGRFAGEMSEEVGTEVIPVTDLAGALGESDVCVTCTPSRRPFLMREHVRAGTFVAGVGADNPLKQELDPALLASNKGPRVTTGADERASYAGRMPPSIVGMSSETVGWMGTARSSTS
jgi:ornithine cyclodeaminase/alanine dehydrogenase